MAQVLDYSAGKLTGEQIKSLGYQGVMRYISPARETWMTAKPVTRAEVEDYAKHHLGVGFVWQYGGAHNPDALRGFAGGVEDAKKAQAKCSELGRPAHPVFFAVDFDCTLDQWNNTVSKYFKGVASILGRQRIGVYGSSRVISWAKEDGLIARVNDNGRVLGWVTRSWNPEGYEHEAVLYQGIHNTNVNGVNVDINEVLDDRWGHQPPRNVSAAAGAIYSDDTPETVTQPDKYYDVDWSPRFNFGSPRNTSNIIGVCVHTTENSSTTPAENVANYQITSESGSYHVLVDTTGKRLRANTDDWVTWSTGNKGNDVLLHVSFVSRAAWTRDKWLAYPKMLRAGATVVAHWCKKYNIPPHKVTAAGLPGLVGHGDTRVWGGTDHTDPGPSFPWDVFEQLIEHELTRSDQQEDLLSALTPQEQRELLTKTREIHHELTHRFDSRYDLDSLRAGEISEQEVYKDSSIGYALNTNRDVYHMRQNMLPAIFGLLNALARKEGIIPAKEDK